MAAAAVAHNCTTAAHDGGVVVGRSDSCGRTAADESTVVAGAAAVGFGPVGGSNLQKAHMSGMLLLLLVMGVNRC